jgi:hypothetical protein
VARSARIGLQKALGYLIGEKLLNFLRAADEDPAFAGEFPRFVGEITLIFDRAEVESYLATAHRVGALDHVSSDEVYEEFMNAAAERFGNTQIFYHTLMRGRRSNAAALSWMSAMRCLTAASGSPQNRVSDAPHLCDPRPAERRTDRLGLEAARAHDRRDGDPPLREVHPEPDASGWLGAREGDAGAGAEVVRAP